MEVTFIQSSVVLSCDRPSTVPALPTRSSAAELCSMEGEVCEEAVAWELEGEEFREEVVQESEGRELRDQAAWPLEQHTASLCCAHLSLIREKMGQSSMSNWM